MFSSEIDPFENLKLAYEELSEDDSMGGKSQAQGQQGSHMFGGSRLSMEELKQMQEAYMAEAKRLQKEVEELEEDLDENNMASLSIPSTSLESLRNILKMTDDEDQGMLSMHKMQSTLSGVHLTDATTQITSNNPHSIIRRQRLEGTCSGLQFAATFEVKETLVQLPDEEKSEASTSEEEGGEEAKNREKRRAVITKLDLEVDPCCLGETMTFLTEAEQGCRLQPFLRGYAEYATWLQHRVRAFTHFKQEYPETVSLPEGPGGTVLQISCPQQRGITYTITWKIELASSGRAIPDLSLSVKFAKEVTKLDTKKTLSRAPEEFQKMVHTMGVEKALSSFLSAVALI